MIPGETEMPAPRHPTRFKMAPGALALALLAAPAAMASTRGAGLESRGPDCAVAMDAPRWRGVWLGHFSGGNLQLMESGDRGVFWRDRYVCFPSRASCEAWQSSMKRVWRQVEGYKTCLPIRQGPLQAIPARYAPAPSGYAPATGRYTPAGSPDRDVERSLD